MIQWLGGDEFTVLLPHIHSQQDVVEVTNRILQSAHSMSERVEYDLILSVSIGVAIYPSDGEDTKDEALYDAKRQGKNTCVFYSSP